MQRSILILLSVLALAACSHKPAPDKAAKPAGSTLTLKDDGTAFVYGKVTAKQGDCTIGACTLTVAANAREVRIIYGDSVRPCPAGALGPQIMVGEEIRAGGNYARDGEDGLIDVCTGRGGYLERKGADDKDGKDEDGKDDKAVE